MIRLRNAFTVAWCLLALTAPLSSHAASDPTGLDFVTAMNPQSGSAFRSAMIWYLKGVADQREVTEVVNNRRNKMSESDWTICRNSLPPEALATKVAEKIMELKLDKQPMAFAVSMAVGASCDSQEDKLYKFGLQIQ
jgi:hypothetical protein